MAHCVICSSAIIDDDQYYMMCNIGPELSTIIKQNLGHEIAEDGLICGQCFDNVQDVTSMSSSNIKQEDPLLAETNTNVCVYCQSSMFNKPCQMVGDGPLKQFISERISPRIIPDGSRVCYSCWKDIKDSLQAQGITCTTPVNTNICVWCQVSLVRRRKHLIPDGPERDEILKQIHPRKIPDGSRVCYSCWKRIRDSLQAQGIPCTPLVDTNICVWCQVSLAKRRTHSIPDGPERNEIVHRIHPREIPPGGQVCYACWIRACRNLKRAIDESDGLICGQYFDNVQDVTSMSSSNIKQEDPLLAETNTNVCVYCQSSMFNKPCQMVGDGPLKQFISERISPRIIPDGSRVCYSCWKDIQDSLQAQGITVTTPVNTNICVWCQVSLVRRRKHLIPDGPERDEILKQIHPREIPDGSRVCYSCWKRIQDSLQAQGIPCSPLVDTNICVWCQVSLAKRRRHSIPDGPERNEIVHRIHPREIPPGGQVCHACWIRACRNLKRAIDESDPSQRDNCVWCGISLFRRKTRTLTGPEREKVAAGIYPREMPQHAHVCSDCFARAQEIIKIEQGHVIDVETKNPAMTLDNFSHTTSSSSHCFVPGCHNPERHIVPDYLRKRILTSQRVFVTENARICVEHKSVFNWEFLDRQQFSNTFTKLEMESMLELSIKEIEFNFDFENFEVINDTLFEYWTGVDKEKYVRILNIISPAFESSDKPKTALGVYLIKVKTGDTHERIASLLGINKSTVSRILEKARTALLKVGQENIELPASFLASQGT